MPEPLEFLHSVIQAARLKLIEVDAIMSGLTPDNAEWDCFVQVQKDLRKFIADQEHTHSLVQDGMI